MLYPSLVAPPARLGDGASRFVGGSEPSLSARLQQAPTTAWMAAPTLPDQASHHLRYRSLTVMLAVLVSSREVGEGLGRRQRIPNDPGPESIDLVVRLSLNPPPLPFPIQLHIS